MRPWALAAAALLSGRASVPAAGPAQTPAEWTREYSALRANYYLKHAGQMVDVALKHHRARLQGKPSPDPYLKVWDAQSQVSAALSWDAGSAELWLEAGNLTLTLAGLMRAINEGDLLHDCLGYWAHALELEAAASAGGQRPLASRLRGWLKQLAAAPEPEMKTSVRTRVLLQVRGDAWKAVQRWAKDPPLARGIPQRKMGRVERQIGLISAQAEKGLDDTCTQASTDDGCDARGPGAAPRPRQGGDWLGAKLGEGKQLVFPTTIYRTNLRQELGAALFHKLSTVAAAKYSEYSEKMRKKSATITEYDINNRFFSFQEVNEHAFSNPRVVKKWPELYGTDEFKTILRLARNASLAYFNHSGIDVEADELERSWIIMWAAVYPQDPALQGRHGWHTHQESILSGIFYANPQSTPLLFADPRGAPPIEDYEQYKADDLMFEPKAPFDAPYQLHAESGDLVVFPSWLVHKVPPPLHGSGSEHRVAFPFNFHLGTPGGGKGTVWDGWERTVRVVS